MPCISQYFPCYSSELGCFGFQGDDMAPKATDHCYKYHDVLIVTAVAKGTRDLYNGIKSLHYKYTGNAEM